jgi:hypothetical protein
MLSKRFLIVPLDSSAAKMPLPLATIARATFSNSLTFMTTPPFLFIGHVGGSTTF